MRSLIGLSALAALQAVAAQPVLVTPDNGTGVLAIAPVPGQSPLAKIDVYQNTVASAVAPLAITPSGNLNSGTFQVSLNWAIFVPNECSTVQFRFITSNLTGQMQYRWAPNYPSPAAAFPGQNLSPTSYTCDPCAGGTAISCNSSVGPGSGASPSVGFSCAVLTRLYTMSGLVPTVNNNSPIVNSFSVQVFDLQTNPAPNVSSYSFQVVRNAPTIHGDPQIVGMQGQDFQVHGVPDEIFNMITAPALQVNARFVYLSSAECHDNFTACFAHPGTYISEEGIRVGADKVHVKAGSFKKGLTVKINGQKTTAKTTDLKSGSVELVNHRRVVISTPTAVVAISNSDKFLNQQTQLLDAKLMELGAQRRKLLVGESFHPEVPMHGLQGQTWRNVEYPSGLDYEGSIADYQIADGNLFGTSFVFNKFKQL